MYVCDRGGVGVCIYTVRGGVEREKGGGSEREWRREKKGKREEGKGEEGKMWEGK